MALSPDQAGARKLWLKNQLRKEFKNAVFSVQLARTPPYDFTIHVIHGVDISGLVKNRVHHLLPQANPDVRYVDYLKPL